MQRFICHLHKCRYIERVLFTYSIPLSFITYKQRGVIKGRKFSTVGLVWVRDPVRYGSKISSCSPVHIYIEAWMQSKFYTAPLRHFGKVRVFFKGPTEMGFSPVTFRWEARRLSPPTRRHDITDWEVSSLVVGSESGVMAPLHLNLRH